MAYPLINTTHWKYRMRNHSWHLLFLKHIRIKCLVRMRKNGKLRYNTL